MTDYCKFVIIITRLNKFIITEGWLKMWFIISGVLLFLMIPIVLVSFKLARLVISPPIKSIAEAMKEETEKKYFLEEDYHNLKKEDFVLSSKYKYDLSCQLITSDQPSNKYIVFCHGYGFNRVGSIKYVDIFLDQGFHVLLYDHRNSGENEKSYTTMGYYEKEDLKLVIDYLYKRFGDDILIGTHGESMGAATVLLHCTEDERVKFVIADCPYSDLKKQLAFRLKVEYHLPAFPFLHIASLIARIKAGFFFGAISPIDAIMKSQGLPHLPILFIHGDEDAYILPYMSQDLYDVKRGYKKLYFAKGADHAISVCTDKKEYSQQIHNFLQDIL